MNEIPSPTAALHQMTVVVMGALLVCLCSCMQGQADPGSSFHKGIQRDAWRTTAAYNAAALAHREKFHSEIPPAYWDPGIQRLHPVKVYTHRANLVVVQRMSGGNEKGKYIYLTISSFLPVSAWFSHKHVVDGFVFRPNWRNSASEENGITGTKESGFIFRPAWKNIVFDYTRTPPL